MATMVLQPQIEFRRCPGCRRVEVVETGEAVSDGRDHQLCAIPQDRWVHFTAPADWRPAPEAEAHEA